MRWIAENCIFIITRPNVCLQLLSENFHLRNFKQKDGKMITTTLNKTNQSILESAVNPVMHRVSFSGTKSLFLEIRKSFSNVFYAVHDDVSLFRVLCQLVCEVFS